MQTPFTEYLKTEWPAAMYIPDIAISDDGRRCVLGALPGTCFPWTNRQDIDWFTRLLLDERIFHYNNRHGHAAAIAAMEEYERTWMISPCPGHDPRGGHEELRMHGPCSLAPQSFKDACERRTTATRGINPYWIYQGDSK